MQQLTPRSNQAYISQIEDWEDNLLSIRRIPLIIGITGPVKVGKTKAARILVSEYGFVYININDELRNYARLMGHDETNWRVIYSLGTELRKRFGNNFLIKKAFLIIRENIGSWNKVVIDGINHPEDARYLKSIPSAFLLGLDSSEKKRLIDAKKWYPLLSEEIRSRDKAEQYKHDQRNPFAPNVSQCLSMADNVIIIRDGPDEPYRLQEEIGRLVKEYIIAAK